MATRASKTPSEQQLHHALVDFFKKAEPLFPDLCYVKHTPNESLGGRKVRIRDRVTGRPIEVPLDVLRGGKLGIRKGAWDFEYLGVNCCRIGPVPANTYRGCAMELKSASGRLSDEQRAWQERYERNGWYCVVFRDWCAAAAFWVRWVGGDVSRVEGLLEQKG